MSDPYIDPATGILRNTLGIADRDELDRVERRLVTIRLEECTPTGNFDLQHLKSIHHHLFQDVYDWAGQERSILISKGGDMFIPPDRIASGMADVHRRIEAADYLRGLDADAFAQKAGEIIGDVNHVHPFREGNGRTQLEYLRQLGEQAGHQVDLARLDPERWINASRAAQNVNFVPMADEIRRVLDAGPSLEKQRQERETIRAADEEERLQRYKDAGQRQRDLGRDRDR